MLRRQVRSRPGFPRFGSEPMTRPPNRQNLDMSAGGEGCAQNSVGLAAWQVQDRAEATGLGRPSGLRITRQPTETCPRPDRLTNDAHLWRLAVRRPAAPVRIRP